MIEKLLEKKNLILAAIILVATFLRIWNLSQVPPSASMDEASIGWNAYSVLKTGGDEFGQFPLISQRGYDDWRRSTYLLLTIPFIALFDLNPVPIRLPSVIMSILTVVSTYYIVLHLFKKKNEVAQITALLSAFILAISPWHVYISRLGHESNACLSFLVFAILFFLKGLRKSWFLILSMMFFLLSMISYYSGQVFVPIFGLILLIVYRKEIFKIIKKERLIQISTILFVLILIPLLINIFSPSSLTRFDGTSTFSISAHEDMYKEMVMRRNEAEANGNIIGEILNNRRLYPVYVWMDGYLSHFDPIWLFSNPFEGTHKVPNLGLLYIWELPFLLIGVVVLLTIQDIGKKEKILFVTWLLLGPFPASIATQTPHAMRSYNFLPTWQVLSAIGIVYFFFKFRKIGTVGVSILIIIMALGIISLYKNYFIVFSEEQSKSFHYALGQTIPFISKNEEKYKKIVFSNEDNLYQSYMVFLYYKKYDPLSYQKEGGTISGGYAETHKFAKYEFRPIEWDKEEKGTLIVANLEDIPKNEKRMFEGKYKDGKIGVVVVEK